MRLKKCLAALLTVAIIGGSFSNPVQAANVEVKPEESTQEEAKVKPGSEPDEAPVNVEYSDDDSEVFVEEYVDVEGGRTVPHYTLNRANGDTWNYTYYKRNGKIMKDCFFFDGSYTYYLQSNGTPMKDKLTYHPDGKHLIYFDTNGREIFNKFKYCSSVGYTCYFDSNGYLYKDKITFYNNEAYYLDGNGKMQEDGWFQFANGYDYGFAYDDGALDTDGFNYDPWGRVVYYHWNGMVARGLISDGNNYYNFDLSDGHYLGSFSAGNPNPVYGVGKYIVGVNIPATEIIITGTNPLDVHGASIYLYDSAGKKIRSDWASSQILSLQNGQILYILAGTGTANIGSRYVDISSGTFLAKIGVHLPAGVYRIQNNTSESGYVMVWKSRTGYSRDLAYSKTLLAGSSYVDVRVSNGQVLDVYNCSVQYIGQ